MNFFSIIMPINKFDRYLYYSIESIFNQSFQDWELILILDTLEKSLPQFISKYLKDPRLKVIRNNKNLGAGISRKKGIEKASGKYITFLDSDDKWTLNRLRIIFHFIQKTNAKAIYTSYLTIGKKNNLKIANKVLKKMDFKYINPVGFSTCCVEKGICKIVGFPEIRKRNDMIFHYLVASFVDYYPINIPTMYYRSGTGMTSNKFGLIKYQWQTYRKYMGKGFIKSIYSLLFWGIVKFLNLK